MRGDHSSFWAKVERRGLGECWLWCACINDSGYGSVRFRGKQSLAHRVSFELAHGRQPTPCCLHRCDTPACVNPAHLYEGTQAENISDRHDKGRDNKGDRHSWTRVADADVQLMRAEWLLCRVTRKELAQSYGVDRSTVSRILRGKRRTSSHPHADHG